MHRSDEELIMEYQAGDIVALEEIFNRYKAPILNFSLRILGNRADAEDVVGEVFVALSSHKYTQRPQAKFSTWLFTVARNLSISRIRNRKKISSLWFRNNEKQEDELWDIPDEKPTSSQDLAQKDMAVCVKKAIVRLPIEQKEAIVLREYHDLSYQEISEVLDITIEKVKILIFRAREQLRRELLAFVKEG